MKHRLKTVDLEADRAMNSHALKVMNYHSSIIFRNLSNVGTFSDYKPTHI